MMLLLIARPNPVPLAFALSFNETLEYVADLVGGDAATGILHVKIPTSVRLFAVAETDVPLPGKFCRVVDEVVHHLQQTSPVGMDRAARHAFLCRPLLWPDRIFSCGPSVRVPP